jgi:SAM-dependent methyltransferase
MNSIEIFKTNIQNNSEANQVSNALKAIFPKSKFNFDLDDPEKILRVENPPLNSELIVQVLRDNGYVAKLIPDKVCDSYSNSPENMRNFWDMSFESYQTMWGLKPCNSAIYANRLFSEKHVNSILIPGFGYGRNAQYFIENGMAVTGIEISKVAVNLARQRYNLSCDIFIGSVTDMPFNEQLYDGIFCYATLHLLKLDQRKKMISDCYDHLNEGGTMIFSVVSKNSSNYGKGKEVAKDTYEISQGAQIFFYDYETVIKDFKKYGLTDFKEIEEPNTAALNGSSSKFILITCEKLKLVIDA